jgi:hypothetical protein
MNPIVSLAHFGLLKNSGVQQIEVHHHICLFGMARLKCGVSKRDAYHLDIKLRMFLKYYPDRQA